MSRPRYSASSLAFPYSVRNGDYMNRSTPISVQRVIVRRASLKTVQRKRTDAARARRAALLNVGGSILRGPRVISRLAEADAFVAYARADIAIARALVQDLRTLGYRVGWDHDLRSGHQFRKRIAETLAKVQAVLVIWSERAFESDFVSDEADVAHEQQKLISTIVPDGIPSRCIPLGFRSLHWISVLETDEIVHALEELGVRPSFGR